MPFCEIYILARRVVLVDDNLYTSVRTKTQQTAVAL